MVSFAISRSCNRVTSLGQFRFEVAPPVERISVSLLLALFSGTLLFSPTSPSASPQEMNKSSYQNDLTLTPSEASHFAQLALKCVNKEYPNKPDHTINDGNDVKSPRAMHPAFYGCFDWHSSVHGHWMLVRLLRLFPDLKEASQIRSALTANLAAENIAVEVTYLNQPNRQSFERTYGWAWLLKLAEELGGWNDADGKRWSSNLQPLANTLVEKYLSFLPKQCCAYTRRG